MGKAVFALSVFVIAYSGLVWAGDIIRASPPTRAANLDAWVDSLNASEVAQ